MLQMRMKEAQEETERERTKFAEAKKSGRVTKKTVEALKEETQRLQEKFVNATNQLKRQADEIIQLEENARATEEENRTLRMAAENARRTCNDVEVSLQNAAKDRKEMEVSFKEESERIKNEMKQEHGLIQKAKLDAEEKLVKMTKHVGKLERMKIDSEQELKRINEELIEANDQKGKSQRSLEATLSKLEEVTVELKSRMDSEQVLKMRILEANKTHKETKPLLLLSLRA